MKNKFLKVTHLVCLISFLASCAGVKVIHPNDKKENVVKTYTCSIVASNGKRVSAVGKTLDEARDEALARCRDKTIISVCLPKNTKCSER